MGLAGDLRELLLPRLCPVCGKLMVRGEDVLCAFCAIGLPRCRFGRLNNLDDDVNDDDDVNPNDNLNDDVDLNVEVNSSVFPLTSSLVNDNFLLRSLWGKADVRRAMAFLSYNHFSPYHRLVVAFKFGGKRDLAFRLGRWAAMEAERLGFWDGIDALVPVPLTRWRRWVRGYNQAEALARGMADVTGLPVVNLICRTKHRKPQSSLKGLARLRNAEGIYKATVPDEWRGKTFAIVDDVMTTGATLGNCAQAILDADKSATICAFPLCYAE